MIYWLYLDFQLLEVTLPLLVSIVYIHPKACSEVEIKMIASRFEVPEGHAFRVELDLASVG